MEQIIPSWPVSVLAVLAALALWRVQAMPWRIRLSLVLPLTYFGLAYFWYTVTPLPAHVRVDLTRLGLIMVFSSFIVNAMLARWKMG